MKIRLSTKCILCTFLKWPQIGRLLKSTYNTLDKQYKFNFWHVFIWQHAANRNTYFWLMLKWDFNETEYHQIRSLKRIFCQLVKLIIIIDVHIILLSLDYEKHKNKLLWELLARLAVCKQFLNKILFGHMLFLKDRYIALMVYYIFSSGYNVRTLNVMLLKYTV